MGDSTPPAGDWVVAPSIEVCVEQCGSKCCRTSSLFLQLRPEEEALFDGYPIRNHMDVNQSNGVRKIKGRFLWFQDTNGRCPHLKSDGFCGIYDNRPTACRGFPAQPTPGCLVWPLPWPKPLTPLPSPDGDDPFPFAKLND